ncbi:type II toxin-antitoxin system ParD family antitoxin [Budviciaceae bacterium BWR-B9]|uniref:Type II toxin-antitoxin system ParD family antitoxin n=1 Tax=Limnobaculum allomyrinae TaxID=2791986 RepID=A0ABS1IRJ9_9GAMM|nr:MULTISPECIES: type II toxin-antitoxin system ParD family antitoxin [Limnobaculum]MBK5144383.1 type II toxin-antitoxin system ParD family antitoxin [Limnobaculum allomyrinae]MBV7691872.1 type II toxin-antitoxin system ParD family antitoxin [Limnobaculum sp. M2-1]
MLRTISVDIDDRLDDFVKRMIADGRYSSVNEVVCSALRLLEQREARVSELRDLVLAGEESGESGLSLRTASQIEKRSL